MAKNAQRSQVDTARIASRLFWAPAPRRMIIPTIALSIFGGFLLIYPRTLAESWLDLLYRAVFVFAFPAFVSTVVTKPLAESLGGRMYLRRSALLAFIGLIVVNAILLVATVGLTIYSVSTGLQYRFSVPRAVLLGYAAVLWTRAVILAATSQSSHLRSLPAALVQPILGLLGLALFVPTTLADWATAAIVFGIFLATAIGFTEIAKRPLQKAFGFDGLRLMRFVLDHLTEQGDEGREEIEAFFTKIAVPARVRVGVLSIHFRSGRRGALIAPMVHPGPLGRICGSDLPAKLRARLSGTADSVFVVHGPTTHDENPANTNEVNRVADLAKELLLQARHGSLASSLVRVAERRANVCVQMFGEAALIVASLAPNPTDDIESAIGFAATQEARLAGAEEAVFVDAHNCLEVGSGLTHFGSEAAHDIITATRKAVERARAAPRGSLKAGVASRTNVGTPRNGIGSEGIQALVFEVEGRKNAYLVFDGNNMVPGLREKILERLQGTVDDAEVLTTDNHSVNITLGGFNPVGVGVDPAVLVDLSETVVREAVAALEPAEAGIASGHVDNLLIFGPESAARLTTSVNSTVAILRPASAVTFLLALTASVLSLFLID